MGWLGHRPLHVVAADNAEANETIVITVYEPDPPRWEPGFRRRRSTARLLETAEQAARTGVELDVREYASA